jgi:uncharacterized protein (DUF362 family)
MKRRDFLTSAAGLALASNIHGFAALLDRRERSNEKSIVYQTDNSKEKIALLCEIIFNNDHTQQLIPVSATILFKPNLCVPTGERTGATTSVALLSTLAETFIAKGFKKIIIADHTLGQTEDFANHPINELPKQFPEVKVMFANEERYYEEIACDGKVLKSVSVLKLFRKADLVINIAAAKHHSAAQVSLCIKNLMGAIWNRTDFHTAMDLHQAVGDLPIALKPHFNIIDASKVLLTGGPTGPGRMLGENKIYAGYDITALDSFVASKYNFGNKAISGRLVPHIQAAFDNGLGNIDPELIQLIEL